MNITRHSLHTSEEDNWKCAEEEEEVDDDDDDNDKRGG